MIRGGASAKGIVDDIHSELKITHYLDILGQHPKGENHGHDP